MKHVKPSSQDLICGILDSLDDESLIAHHCFLNLTIILMQVDIAVAVVIDHHQYQYRCISPVAQVCPHETFHWCIAVWMLVIE